MLKTGGRAAVAFSYDPEFATVIEPLAEMPRTQATAR